MPFIIFALSIGLTALGFISEVKDGLIPRVYAAGVRPIEIVLAQYLSQLFVLAVQVTFMLIFALLVFGIPLAGNLAYVIIIMGLMGFLGMTYGIFISTVTTDQVAAIQMALGTFFPILLLSGVLWPVEGIPVPLIYLSYALPTTWGGNVVRSVLIRGWSFGIAAVRFSLLVCMLVGVTLAAGLAGHTDRDCLGVLLHAARHCTHQANPAVIAAMWLHPVLMTSRQTNRNRGKPKKIKVHFFFLQAMQTVHAIEATALSRHYGSGKHKVHVLNSINMTLPRGCVASVFYAR